MIHIATAHVRIIRAGKGWAVSVERLELQPAFGPPPGVPVEVAERLRRDVLARECIRYQIAERNQHPRFDIRMGEVFYDTIGALHETKQGQPGLGWQVELSFQHPTVWFAAVKASALLRKNAQNDWEVDLLTQRCVVSDATALARLPEEKGPITALLTCLSRVDGLGLSQTRLTMEDVAGSQVLHGEEVASGEMSGPNRF